MHVWRLARRAHQALDGEGARLAGGRWNRPGVALVYTSATVSLAALEYLVHVDLEDVPGDLIAMCVELPDGALIEEVAIGDLPKDWNRQPQHPACVEIGDEWAARAETLALRVPSAIVPEEFNYLINPAHPEAATVRVIASREFSFDARLL